VKDHHATIENNLVLDTMNYPGIMLATDHSPQPFSGQTVIANNGLFRCGGVFWNEDQEFGAITRFAASRDIAGVTIRDTDMAATCRTSPSRTSGSTAPTTAGILAMSGARGNATLTNVTITNLADGDIVRQPGTPFVITGG
jgi:hypothetical protein